MGYPTLLFINSDAKVVHRFVGAPKLAEDFLEIGKIALDTTERLASYQEKFKAGNLEGEFIFKYLHRLDQAYIPKQRILRDYFATQQESDLSSRTNWNIIYKHVSKMNSREFKYLLSHQEEFIEKYTEDSVNNKIYTIFLQQCFKHIGSKDFDIDKYESLKNKIRKSNFKKADQLIVTADLHYYRRNGKWKDYISLAIENVDKYYLNDYMTLNNIAWNFLDNTNKDDYLVKAEKWSRKSVELESKAFNNDTLAAILYKLGKKEEAIKYQEIALELAEKEGRPTKSYEERLAKMKK